MQWCSYIEQSWESNLNIDYDNCYWSSMSKHYAFLHSRWIDSSIYHRFILVVAQTGKWRSFLFLIPKYYIFHKVFRKEIIGLTFIINTTYFAAWINIKFLIINKFHYLKLNNLIVVAFGVTSDKKYKYVQDPNYLITKDAVRYIKYKDGKVYLIKIWRDNPPFLIKPIAFL